VRNASKILVKKSERKVSPDDLRVHGSITWKMDYKAAALQAVYWIHLAQDTNYMHPIVTKIMFG
jgi:hypothetical protein